MTDPVILWFRADLRLHDNPALHAALAGKAPVIPVYIHADEEAAPWTPGAASRWWLHHSLQALAESIRALGGQLLLRHGPSETALAELLQQSGARSIYCNRIYEPALRRRDQQLYKHFRQQDVTFNVYPGNLLREPDSLLNLSGQAYKVFTPYYKRLLREGWDHTVHPAPASWPALSRTPPSLSLDELQLLPRIAWDSGLAQHWTPGESAARHKLQDFISYQLEDYPQLRDRPASTGTSGLSPHLQFGELSVREITRILMQLRAARPIAAGREAYIRELIWREFAHYVLFHFPHTTGKPFDPRFVGFPWQRSRRRLNNWQHGQTGFPIVDAGMRELWHTGSMHNRVRMIVASLLCKNAMQHWQQGARWFWDTLVDASLAANTLNWQWVAGCGVDAAPYFRIFNPVTQSQKFDPAGAYLRRWVPELRNFPDKHIHAPWLAPQAIQQQAGCLIGRDYPEPILDLKTSREAALSAYQAHIKQRRDDR